MTDTAPFVAPEVTAPPSRPSEASVDPQSRDPRDLSRFQAPPPVKRGSKGLVIGLIAGGLVFLALVVAAALFAVQALGRATEQFGDNPFLPPEEKLVAGDAASADAVAPVECPVECLNGSHIDGTVIERKELLSIGLSDVIDPSGTFATSTSGSEYYNTKVAWNHDHGTPAECLVTYFSAPVAFRTLEEPAPDTSIVEFTGSFGDPDGMSELSQTTRLFPDSASAVQHMHTMKDAIADCTHYESGLGDARWEADVTPAPALSIPDSAAAVGWVESSDMHRYYAFDVQRGNIVVRVTLSTGAGDVSEAEFRGLIEHYADQLAALQPSADAPY